MLCWSSCSKGSVFTTLLEFSESQKILHSFITAAKERIDVTDLDNGHHLLEKLTGLPSSFNTCQENCLNQFLMDRTWPTSENYSLFYCSCCVSFFSFVCFSAFLSEIHYCHGSKWFEWKDSSLWFNFLEGCALVFSIPQNKINSKKYIIMCLQ